MIQQGTAVHYITTQGNHRTVTVATVLSPFAFRTAEDRRYMIDGPRLYVHAGRNIRLTGYIHE